MTMRVFAILMGAAFLIIAAPKKEVASAKGENEDLILSVTLYLDSASIKELVGSDLDGHYILASVKVEPKYGKEIVIDRDDFQLLTNKDGDKAKPFDPGQIAGRGALVISQKGQTGAASPGMVGLGGPVIVGGRGGVAAGPGENGGQPAATMRNAAQDKENPLEKVLADKILPEKKTEQPVSGLLYFPMEKQKMKDLELTYGGRENRITLRFK